MNIVRRHGLSPLAILVLTICFAGCGADDLSNSVDDRIVYPPYPWPVSTQLQAGLDSVRIDSALALVRDNTFIFSFLVARHDSLAVEYYRQPLTQYNDYDIRSATKSFVSVLVGIALKDGAISDIDAPFLQLFPEYREANMDPRKDSITIRHLLTMRGGFDYVDGGRNSDVVAASDDWIRAFMELPLMFSPGERFAYSSPQTHLLSAIVSRATGKTTSEFLETRLFAPLKISLRYWDTDPLGYNNGGTGMFLTPRDMLRFGQLVLRRGTLEGADLVSGAWLDSSFVARNFVDVSWADFSRVNYGYQWWMNLEPGKQVWMAAGYGGQFILIDRTRDLVVVTTAETPADLSSASVQEVVILQIIARYILPSAG